MRLSYWGAYQFLLGKGYNFEQLDKMTKDELKRLAESLR